jgi:hypothetical protein
MLSITISLFGIHYAPGGNMGSLKEKHTEAGFHDWSRRDFQQYAARLRIMDGIVFSAFTREGTLLTHE